MIKKILLPGFLVTIGNILFLIASFVFQMIMAAYFGASEQTDAYWVAYSIPTYVYSLIFSGIPFVVIPIFIRDYETGHEAEAKAFVGTFLRITLFLAISIGIVLFLFSEQILSILAPGLMDSTRKLASVLLRVLSFTLPFLGVWTLTSSIENARKSFLWPSLSQAIGIFMNLLTLLALFPRLGILALGWSTLIGSVAQSIITTMPTLSFALGKNLTITDSRILESFKRILPVIVFGLFNRAIPLLERYFASNLPIGAISYLGYGAKISAVLQVILGAGISTVILPELSSQYVENGKTGIRYFYLETMRLTWLVCFPVILIMIVFPLPIIKILFQRGNFTEEASLAIARILPLIMLTTMCNIVGNIVGRVLYVQGKTFGFNFWGAVVVAVYPLFASLFLPKLGYLGLALTNSLINFLGVIGGYFLLWREIGVWETPYLPRYAFAIGISFVFLQLINCNISGWGNSIISLFIGVILGVVFYFISLIWLDRQMFHQLCSRLLIFIRGHFDA
jgi:putative peptidoglycan lipid II flippase